MILDIQQGYTSFLQGGSQYSAELNEKKQYNRIVYYSRIISMRMIKTICIFPCTVLLSAYNSWVFIKNKIK